MCIMHFAFWILRFWEFWGCFYILWIWLPTTYHKLARSSFNTDGPRGPAASPEVPGVSPSCWNFFTLTHIIYTTPVGSRSLQVRSILSGLSVLGIHNYLIYLGGFNISIIIHHYASIYVRETSLCILKNWQTTILICQLSRGNYWVFWIIWFHLSRST